MNGIENAHLSLCVISFCIFCKFISHIIVDRLSFGESNNFMLVTLIDCKIVLIIQRILQLLTNIIESLLHVFFAFTKYIETSA